ncbi:hypothetical protein BOX15_Mlig029469g1 [Macrostomum lignano]|nr:hypothetical protein BOX15_Mlig029469g2 [Macrostomum lignano]PAA46219.1 hypothetical protein BOX15_Mlig029469g3 [Macrostomum lignano]PAA65634.1 hypothetical protein BOX15_Mlig029469g1 [Macrostomum lignano]
MGNTVDKMRQRELAKRESKREELVAFLESSKRRHSLLEVNGQLGADEAQQAYFADGDRQAAFARGQLAAQVLDGDDDHRLTDREREAWLYRMENEALEVMNDNMELQEERRRERERREERREELENMGVDGMGDPDHDDANANRDEPLQDERSPVSSRQSSLAVSDDDDTADDDFASDEPDDDDFEEEVDADEPADEASVGAESDRDEPEPMIEETGGGDDEE